jgi:hypothetical protein
VDIGVGGEVVHVLDIGIDRRGEEVHVLDAGIDRIGEERKFMFWT